MQLPDSVIDRLGEIEILLDLERPPCLVSQARDGVGGLAAGLQDECPQALEDVRGAREAHIDRELIMAWA